MRQAFDESGNPVPCIKPGTTQVLSVSGTAAATAAFARCDQVVRFVSTTDCFIAIGADPTATNQDVFVPSYMVEYFRVDTGDKLSVIQSVAGGTAYVTPATSYHPSPRDRVIS